MLPRFWIDSIKDMDFGRETNKLCNCSGSSPQTFRHDIHDTIWQHLNWEMWLLSIVLHLARMLLQQTSLEKYDFLRLWLRLSARPWTISSDFSLEADSDWCYDCKIFSDCDWFLQSKQLVWLPLQEFSAIAPFDGKIVLVIRLLGALSLRHYMCCAWFFEHGECL